MFLLKNTSITHAEAMDWPTWKLRSRVKQLERMFELEEKAADDARRRGGR